MYPKISLKVGAFELSLESQEPLAGKDHVQDIKALATALLLLHRSYEQYVSWVDGKPISEPSAHSATQTAPPAPAPESRSFQQPLTGYVTIPVTKIVRGNDGTKEFTRVYGGNWTKFGIPAYADSCHDVAGIFGLPLGTHEGEAVKGLVATVVVKEQSPLKISEVRKDVPSAQTA